MAGYTPALATVNYTQASKAPDATAIDPIVTTAATAVDFNPAAPTIPSLTEKNAIGTPTAPRHLMRNLNPVSLPLSRATSGRTIPLPISGQSMSANNASTTFPADAIAASGGQGANPAQGNLDAPSKWTLGAAERPLVIIRRRAPTQLMRAPGEAVSSLPYSDLPEDRYGLVPAPNEDSRRMSNARASEAPHTHPSAPGEPGSDEIAEHAWRIMMERLVIEQERRGLTKWP